MLGTATGQVPLLRGRMGSVLLSKDHFNKELAAPHRKQTISTSAWVAFSFLVFRFVG